MTEELHNGAGAEAGAEAEDDAILPLADVRAHWSLFLPALGVALVYGLALLILAAGGKAQGELARLLLLVLFVAPPLLLAHAFLRYYSIGLAVTENHVLAARGWPRRMGEQVALGDVRDIALRTNWMQRHLGAGNVRLTLKDGSVIALSDLDQPGRVVKVVRRQLRGR